MTNIGIRIKFPYSILKLDLIHLVDSQMYARAAATHVLSGLHIDSYSS